MDNLNLLKSDVYKNEKRKLYFRFFIFNIITLIFITTSLSSVSNTQKDEIILNEKRKNDSLEYIINEELKNIKQREQKLIMSSLSLSYDTNYNEIIPNDGNYSVYDQINSYDNLSYIIENKWDSINSIPIGSPISTVDMNKISDGYGWRKHPILKRWIFHNGTDIAANIGSDVFSTSDGIVEKTYKSRKGYGNRIVINHGYGYKTLYAHLDEIKVKKGQIVKKGDIIGSVGNTGLSTGPHLHYEVLINNRTVNPQQYFYYGDQIAKK